jgi:hypothetical protein
MGFSEDCRVIVEQVDDKNWKVKEPFSYTGGKGEKFDVPLDMTTDFASVPRMFVWLLPTYGAYTKAAIVHDLMWRKFASQDRMNFIDADGIFRRAMRELEVPFWRRWIMWSAVRWGALKKPHGTRGWLKEAWRVIVVTLVALPFVVLPALMILVGLLLFYILEQVTWGFLKISEWVRGLIDRPTDKKVVAPRFDLQLTK